MNMLWRDLRYAVRMLAKNRAFTAVAVLTLALGIGANTAIFTVVNQVVLNPFGYKDQKSLVKIWQTREPSGRRVEVSGPNFLDWHEQNGSFETMGCYSYNETRVLVGKGGPERIIVNRATEEMMRVLGIPPMLGRTFEPGDEQPASDRVALLNYGIWQRTFGGDRDVVGETVRINDEFYTVIGVMPKGYWHAIDVWLQMIFTQEELSEKARGSPFLSVWARLKPGVSLEQAKAEMGTIAGRLEMQYPATNTDSGVTVFSQVQNRADTFAPVVIVLSVAVGFLLLIACANVTHLFLVRAAARQKEVALRAALGASRFRLARQFLTESVIVAALAGGVGILIALLGVKLLTIYGSSRILPRLDTIEINQEVLWFTVGISFLTALLFGLVPAFQVSRVDLNQTLKEGSSRASMGAGGKRLRQVLLVSEFALTTLLLIGAGLMLNNLRRLLETDLGFNSKNLLTLRVDLPQHRYQTPAQRKGFYQSVIERIRVLPGVQSVTAGSSVPLHGVSGLDGRRFEIVGHVPADSEERLRSIYRAVNPGYFQTLGIPLKLGRTFSERDQEGASPVAIVNQELVRRYFDGQNPLGERVRLPLAPGPVGSQTQVTREIIGVAGDVKTNLEDDQPLRPTLYVPYPQDPLPRFVLAVRSTSDLGGLIASVRSQILAVDQDQPIYEIGTMVDRVSRVLVRQRFTAVLISIFAALALLLAAVGTYGMMSYWVSQRIQEIGIRMALGAPRGDVVKMIVWQGLKLIMLGLFVGSLGAVGLIRLLQSELAPGQGRTAAGTIQLYFGVSSVDTATVLVVLVVLAAIGLLAAYIPARRAARIEPMVALRHE